MKLKKGDTVEVITGKDKGKQGEIACVFPKTNKIIVNGVNVATKHQKAQRANDAGRHHRQGHADRREQRDAGPQGQDGPRAAIRTRTTAPRCASPARAERSSDEHRHSRLTSRA